MKKILTFIIAIILCALVAGCGTVPGTENVTTQNNSSGSNNSQFSPPSNNSQFSSPSSRAPLPDSYEYTTAENIHGQSETVTNEDGVSVQLISYDITSEFGNRKKENLSYDDVDENGNLLHGESFVFVTVQFSNPTDKEIEILRNGSGICFIDDQFILQACIGDAYYIDEYWTGGLPSEVYHYRLSPGETITTEVGYVVPQDCVEAFVGHDKLYYIINKQDVLSEKGAFTDPSAVFIEMAEK